MKKVINVTRSDIKHGQRGHCDACMLALAIGRKVLNGSVRVLNSYKRDEVPTAYLVNKNWDTLASLPPKAKENEFRFERGNPVKPFRFTLDLPAKYWKRGTK